MITLLRYGIKMKKKELRQKISRLITKSEKVTLDLTNLMRELDREENER